MQTDKSIPYPRPDYSDGDLLSKELSNGTFTQSLFDDLKSFRPPLSRYSVTEDKLTDISLIRGDITPQSYDITMRDVSLDGVKELGWQPAKRNDTVQEPEIVYKPTKHYVFVEWVGINYTDLQQTIPSSNTVIYNVGTPYYDDVNAGLFGFKTIKDAQGVVTDTFACFYSLMTLTMTVLGRVPNGVAADASTHIGYVNGCFVLNTAVGEYLSFTLTGGVYTINGLTDNAIPLGDDGCFAVEDGAGKTLIFDKTLTQIQSINGAFTSRASGLFSGTTKYVLGTKIGNAYFFGKDDNSSYKYKNTRYGFIVSVVDKPIWKYGKKIKYDYATDNWLHTPLKTLKYNTIRHGIFVKNRFPKHSSGDKVIFPNPDMYGDFVRVDKVDGTKSYYHTFNFKKWSPLTGDGSTYLYGCIGRMWTKGRVDGVVGLMPYSIAVKSVNDLAGSKKTVLQYSGFIFRG